MCKMFPGVIRGGTEAKLVFIAVLYGGESLYCTEFINDTFYIKSSSFSVLPEVTVSLPLSHLQVGDAMRKMQERNNIGKVILTTEPMPEEEKKEEPKKEDKKEDKKKDDKKKDDKKKDDGKKEEKKDEKKKEEPKKEEKKEEEKKEEAKPEEK